MPIQFRCHRCRRLLQTGEGTAGQNAVCPECGAVRPIPAVSEPDTDSPAAGPSSSAAAEPPPQSPLAAAADAAGGDNPYRAPASTSVVSPTAPGEIRPTRIDFADVFKRSGLEIPLAFSTGLWRGAALARC